MISIIIPIYNAEKNLERMLSSIKKQSFTKYEVIMIDDGSVDQSAKICKKFASEDARFHYYYQENSGVSIARNTGLKRAKGEYISFLDADDEIDLDYLKILEETCEKVDIAVCDVTVEDGGRVIKRFTGSNLVLEKKDAINLLLTRKTINSGPYAKLFKREVIGLLEFPVMKTYEDILFNLTVFANANTVAITSRTQYHYIVNSQGAMSSMFKAPSLDIIVASEKIIRFIKQQDEKLNPECLYITISHLFQYIISMLHKECEWNETFVLKTRELYRRYLVDILKCKAVPTKEKVIFSSFIFGWTYLNGKWVCINSLR